MSVHCKLSHAQRDDSGYFGQSLGVRIITHTSIAHTHPSITHHRFNCRPIFSFTAISKHFDDGPGVSCSPTRLWVRSSEFGAVCPWFWSQLIRANPAWLLGQLNCQLLCRVDSLYEYSSMQTHQSKACMQVHGWIKVDPQPLETIGICNGALEYLALANNTISSIQASDGKTWLWNR